MDAQTESQMEVTNEEFQEIIKNRHKLVVVDFYAEWCMPCLMMAPIIDDLSEEDSMKEVKFVKMNIEDNQELAKKHDVSSIPCIIIFKNGEEVDRSIGAQSQEDLQEKIQSHLN